MFATAFDRFRQTRDVSGQIVYKDSGKHIELDKIVYPASVEDDVPNIYKWYCKLHSRLYVCRCYSKL